ncbi:hypothetical protein L3V83_05465 [Thiotrichales bacterium 19X7-9]|nr:hypothetical protein [Thiotrichales bacterium 19X7-9]
MPLFDSYRFSNIYIKNEYYEVNIKDHNDYTIANQFLTEYSDKESTFISYRRELEKLINWAWNIKKVTLIQLCKNDLIEYLDFLKQPPISWIGNSKQRRYITIDNLRLPNTHWRPFVYPKNHPNQYMIKNSSLIESIMILSTFFKFLLNSKYIQSNPVIFLRQELSYKLKSPQLSQVKLSSKQKQLILYFSVELANQNSSKYERTNFILHLIILLGLKPKEIISTKNFTPQMGNFYIKNKKWYLKTSLDRHLEITDVMLQALKRWRKYLSMSPLPAKDDKFPLIPREKGNGGISTQTHLRRLIKPVIDNIILKSQANNGTNINCDLLLNTSFKSIFR